MHSTCTPIPVHPSSPMAVALREAVASLARLVELRVRVESGFAERERVLLDTANEVCCGVLVADLQRVADSHPDEVIVDGKVYRRHQHGVVAYHTLCGDVEVGRCTYRQAGVHNGPTIVPLELAAGLADGATPGLAYSVADGMAEMPSRRFEQVLQAAHRPLPSRSTVERLAKALGNQLKQDIMMLETIVRVAEPLPEGAHAISVGLDRTTVPMAEERPPTQLPSSRRKERTKPRVRSQPHPIDVCYRMAYVGTVAVVDKCGEALVTRKYAATAEEGPDDLVERVMADVRELRRRLPSLPVVVVQDGAPELWGLMWAALRKSGIRKTRLTCVLDRFHVTEHIGAALQEVERDEGKRMAIFSHWRAQLEASDGAVQAFCRWLDKATALKPSLRRDIESHYHYLDSYSRNGFTRYRSLREHGLPTASGVTEGACKSLITARCKRSGQRWQQDGLTAILTLRSVAQSERLPTVWPLFSQRFNRDIQCAA